MRLGAGSRGCWLVIETLILAGNLGSSMKAEPCGILTGRDRDGQGPRERLRVPWLSGSEL